MYVHTDVLGVGNHDKANGRLHCRLVLWRLKIPAGGVSGLMRCMGIHRVVLGGFLDFALHTQWWVSMYMVEHTWQSQVDVHKATVQQGAKKQQRTAKMHLVPEEAT